ncbi:S-adenosyl-L-methionine-dependent methyltransferase [Hypoxylon sp. FL1284]|nr:S-adenosyl-L-methionine-dependent methyltransferase [Hypoxylon sp. FL1284]
MALNTEYVFTRDFLDNTRINLMHHVWTKVFGYIVHPKVPTEAANLRIADVGTGSGIWLIDVGEKLKQARLDGLDISFDAAPPSETLPSNVDFRYWNVRDAVPEDLIGVYDIVHIRFFAFVLLNDEIPDVVAKIFSLLKPGGYLQWAEADMETLRFDTAKPEGQTKCLTELYKLLEVQDARLKPTWIRALPEALARKGFVDIEVDTKDPPPHLAFIFHEASLIIHDQIARKARNEQITQELRRLLPGAVEEVRQGAWGTSLRRTVIGRKP